MPRIPAQLSDFGGAFAGVNGHYDLFPSWGDLVRAAITTGYPNLAAATMPVNFQRTWAVLYRASIVLAYLDTPNGDRILRSDDYNRADRSEKGAISYYLGLFGQSSVPSCCSERHGSCTTTRITDWRTESARSRDVLI